MNFAFPEYLFTVGVEEAPSEESTEWMHAADEVVAVWGPAKPKICGKIVEPPLVPEAGKAQSEGKTFLWDP